MRVILSHSKHLLQPGLGNKSDRQPVMDQPVGNLDFLAVLFRVERPDVDLAALDALYFRFSLFFGKGIDGQELPWGGKFGPYPRFSQFFVMLKRLHRAGFQLRSARLSSIQQREKNQTQGKGTAAPSHTRSVNVYSSSGWMTERGILLRLWQVGGRDAESTKNEKLTTSLTPLAAPQSPRP